MVYPLVMVRSDRDSVVSCRRVWSVLREECSPSAGVVYVRSAGTLLVIGSVTFCYFWVTSVLASFDWRSSV